MVTSVIMNQKWNKIIIQIVSNKLEHITKLQNAPGAGPNQTFLNISINMFLIYLSQ